MGHAAENKQTKIQVLCYFLEVFLRHALTVSWCSRRTETQLPTVVGNWLDNRLFISFLSFLISLPTSILGFLLCDYFLKQLLGLKCSSQDLLLGTPKLDYKTYYHCFTNEETEAVTHTHLTQTPFLPSFPSLPLPFTLSLLLFSSLSVISYSSFS